MKFRATLTIIVLAVGLAFALPVHAQEQPFTQSNHRHGGLRIGK